MHLCILQCTCRETTPTRSFWLAVICDWFVVDTILLHPVSQSNRRWVVMSERVVPWIFPPVWSSWRCLHSAAPRSSSRNHRRSRAARLEWRCKHSASGSRRCSLRWCNRCLEYLPKHSRTHWEPETTETMGSFGLNLSVLACCYLDAKVYC